MIRLEKLNIGNWLEVVNLSVSKEQMEVFPIPNVYWLGISQFEEYTTLYAIVCDNINVGLIGLGYDEDGVSGFINPLMIDAKYQGHGYSKEGLKLAINILKNEYHVPEIHIGHRKENITAGKLYQTMGFEIVDEDEQDYFRNLKL